MCRETFPLRIYFCILRLPSRCILVVHEKAVTSMRLRAEAVEVIAAKDGAKELRMIQDHRPAVVVLDLMEPKVHGFSTL